MAKFTYQAVNTKGNTVTGTVEANDRAGAIAALTREGLQPVSLKEEQKGFGSFNLNIFKDRVKNADLVMFTRQLSTMVSAGVPLLRALNAMQKHTESKALSQILAEVSKDVQGGAMLANALAKHPRAFNEVYVNMVRAGEAAGILDEILKRLAFQQEKNAAIIKKIRSAMTYPAILIVITIGAFFGLMIFVIPQIGNIIQDLGGPDAELPLLTQIMLGISGFFQNYWYIVIGATAALIFILTRYIRTPGGRRAFHTFILRLPVIKGIIIKIANARFTRTFAALLGAGVSVLEALKISGRAIGNVVYEDAIDQAIEEVKNGKQLSEALSNNPLFPAIVSQMMAVGEETGKTDVTLVKVADFYDEEVDLVIDSLSSIIEPAMIIILGSMVGLIAASVMGPISGIAQNIQG